MKINCFLNNSRLWHVIEQMKLPHITGSKAKLVIGLAAYKLGTKEPPDNAEWQTKEDILNRQTKICLDDSDISGICFFSYSYLIN